MNTTNPKISIIVPMYNCAEYAPKCIENIIKQEYQNWELLLTHGDSNDGTEAVCQAYEDKDSRIKNFYHIDGLVPARNVGYENATGDWIMYIDGDDWIDENTLSELMNYAKEYNNPDVIFWDFVQEFEGKIVPKGHKWEAVCDTLYEGDECRYLSYKVLDYNAGINEAYGKIVKRDYALKYDLKHNPNLRQGIEGGEYGMRTLFYASRALFVNKPYYKYRYNPTSLSKVVSYNNVKCISDSLDEIYMFINKNVTSEHEKFMYYLYKRALYALVAVCMSTYFHPKNNKSHRECVNKFTSDLSRFKFFAEAIKYGDYSDFDMKRKFTIFCLKHNYYRIVSLIAYAKTLAVRLHQFDF